MKNENHEKPIYISQRVVSIKLTSFPLSLAENARSTKNSPDTTHSTVQKTVLDGSLCDPSNMCEKGLDPTLCPTHFGCPFSAASKPIERKRRKHNRTRENQERSSRKSAKPPPEQRAAGMKGSSYQQASSH